jgi:hypothetical protein
MKSIIVVSSLTCLLIFGGLAVVGRDIVATVSGSGGDALVPAAAEPAAPSPHGANGSVPRRRPGAPQAQNTAEDGVGAESVQVVDDLLVLRQTLAMQHQTLRLAQHDLAATVAKLDTARQRYHAAGERSIRKLAKVYEAMKPTKAAPILASLDPDIVLQIIGNMQERQAARILAQMDAGLAARISAELGGGGEGS